MVFKIELGGHRNVYMKVGRSETILSIDKSLEELTLSMGKINV